MSRARWRLLTESHLDFSYALVCRPTAPLTSPLGCLTSLPKLNLSKPNHCPHPPPAPPTAFLSWFKYNPTLPPHPFTAILNQELWDILFQQKSDGFSPPSSKTSNESSFLSELKSNCGPWLSPKSGVCKLGGPDPAHPVFINKTLLEHCHTHGCLWLLPPPSSN